MSDLDAQLRKFQKDLSTGTVSLALLALLALLAVLAKARRNRTTGT